MTRKRLPRAITRAIAELREPDAEEAVSEAPKPKRSRRKAAKPPPVEEILPEPASVRDASDALKGEPKGTVEGEVEPPRVGELLPPERHGEPRREGPREAAEKVVERYKWYAGFGGLIPVPAVSVAGLAAINMRMVKALSDVYERPFERDQTRAMIMGLIGGSVPTGLGVVTASMVGLLVPAGAFAGLAVSSLSAAALTRSIGLVFIDYFETGAMPLAATPAATPAP